MENDVAEILVGWLHGVGGVKRISCCIAYVYRGVAEL